MDYKKLGNSELMVAPIGLGCNRHLDDGDTVALASIQKALDLGINHFDSADIYGFGDGETFLGKALKGRRGEAVIASKFGFVRGEDGTLRPTTSDQAVAGGFVVDLATPGAQVWVDGRVVSITRDGELGGRLVPQDVE